MPLSYAVRSPDLADEAKGFYVFTVQSSRTFYKVAIKPEEITLLGPGVREEYEMDEELERLSPEGQALTVVIRFEETDRS